MANCCVQSRYVDKSSGLEFVVTEKDVSRDIAYIYYIESGDSDALTLDYVRECEIKRNTSWRYAND